MRGTIGMLAVLLAMLVSAVPAGASGPPQQGPAGPGLRDVLIVGNNWDGTADVLDVPSFERIRRINVVPDREERVREIMFNPAQLPFYLFVRNFVGEGNDQMVDDMYASNDGRMLFVSRPSFADVVAIDLGTGQIVWRRPIRGVRSDHMAISPDGRHLVVSRAVASGPNGVDVIDTVSGEFVAEFPSGDTPHENVYSSDGSRIFHASIGRIYTPTDEKPIEPTTKGNRVFEIVDARTWKILKQWDMGKKLAEAGFPGMSSAVRPMALSPDEKWLYFQVSFFHGFVEFDLEKEKVTRLAELPIPPETAKLRRDEYILDSAHHGLAMSGDGKKLCAAGTMSNYAAIVDRDDFKKHTVHPLGARTYWSTTSVDGRHCYVSVAGDDTLAVFDYSSEKQVARVPVGDHPQRARTARVSTAIFGEPAKARMRAASFAGRAVSRKRGSRLLVRISGRLGIPKDADRAKACSGVVRVDVRRRGAVVGRGGAKLRRSGRHCVFARTLSVAPGRGRLTAHARFTGNDVLRPTEAKRVKLRRAR